MHIKEKAKMKFESQFLACLWLFVALEAKKLPVLPPSHPYVMTIELIFNEDKITEFIAESFFASISEDLDENKNCNITLHDVLSVLPAEDITSALNELNISLQGDDVTQLIRGLNYSQLTGLGFSAKKVYRNVVNVYFQNATQSLLDCLNILDIAIQFTTAYAFGTDEELFQAFQKGNFSVYNLQEIFAIVNTPLGSVSKTLGLKQYDSPYIKDLVNNDLTELLVKRGLHEEDFRKFLDALELDVGSFKKMKSFKNFYKVHTEWESLGVAVGPNEIITNDESISESLSKLGGYASLKIRSLQNSKIKYLVDDNKVQTNEDSFITTIHIDEDLPDYINKTKNYQGILQKNCTYVSQNIKQKLTAQNVSINNAEGKLIIPKLFGTVYKKGSPLVCESLLYGLAEVDNIDTIGFTMIAGDNVAKIDNNALDGLLSLLTNLFQLFDVCRYTDCKVHGVGTDASDETQEQSENEAHIHLDEAHFGTGAQIQSENDIHDQTELKTEAQIQTAIGGQNPHEYEAQYQSDTKIQLAQTQAEIETQKESENAAQSQPIAQSDTEFNFESDTQILTETETETQNQSVAQNQFETETGIPPEMETQNQSETEPQSQSDDQTQFGTESQIIAESETQNQHENEEKPQIQSESETQNQFENQSNAQIQSGTEKQKEFEIEAQNQHESEAQGQTVNEGQIQSETQNEAQSQPEVQTQFGIQIQSEAETEFQTLSDLEVQFQLKTDPEFQIYSEIEFQTKSNVEINFQSEGDQSETEI